jgi:hypothetical protein
VIHNQQSFSLGSHLEIFEELLKSPDQPVALRKLRCVVIRRAVLSRCRKNPEAFMNYESSFD